MRIRHHRGTQNKLLWHKNCFKPKAFEFLKSLICLNAGPPKRSKKKKNSTVMNPNPGTTQKLVPHLNRYCHKTIISPVYLPKNYLLFHSALLSPSCPTSLCPFASKKSFVLPEVLLWLVLPHSLLR